VADHAVVVAGAGPTGLMLAGELALAGIDVAIIERRSGNDELIGSRAGGMTSRSIEVLDQRGIADRFMAQGWAGQIGHYSGIFIDISDLPTRHNYGLALPQYRIERILADWVSELGVPIYRGREVTGLASTSSSPTARRFGRHILSGATEGAASSARPPASSSRGGIHR
jgi:2-polyprenyl-6-methoxyphenol hydroxylase-like FAD-dependent oxidoreductase